MTGVIRGGISPDDLQNFWAAVEVSDHGRLSLTGSLNEMYLKQASPALAHYIAWTGMTAQRLAEVFNSYSPYYRSLREQPERLGPSLSLAGPYASLRKWMPSAVPAEVRLILGDFSCAGTVAPGTILLGLEFFPPDEVRHLAPSGLLLPDVDHLPAVLAHELVHVQQVARHPGVDVSGFNVLELALLEGAAEYVGVLLSGERTTPQAHAFGEAHRDEVWKAFGEEADQPDRTGWFYGSPSRPGWPPDAGYHVGYELCRRYHADHVDEPDVVEAIVFAFRSPERFLRSC